VGRGCMEKVVEHRRRLREEAIRKARAFAECVRRVGRVTVIVFGSYARGDFNVWSDIDVLVVTGTPLPPNPLRRLDMFEDCLLATSGVEPVILTVEEFKNRLSRRDPAAVEAIEKGITVVDELDLRRPATGHWG